MRKLIGKINAKWSALCLAVAVAVPLLIPGAALAVESPTEEKLKTVTTQVSSEGVSIVLAILAGLVALIAAIIIIPKGIGMIKRFI